LRAVKAASREKGLMATKWYTTRAALMHGTSVEQLMLTKFGYVKNRFSGRRFWNGRKWEKLMTSHVLLDGLPAKKGDVSASLLHSLLMPSHGKHAFKLSAHSATATSPRSAPAMLSGHTHFT